MVKTVDTSGGRSVPYDFLIVAPGLVLDHDAIEGFSLDLVGAQGIGALYAGPQNAAKTWAAGSKFAEEGGVVLFTRPGTEIKCAGAPLKHMFLIEDVATRTAGKGKHEMHYAAHDATLFGVPIVSEKVRMLFEDRAINPHYSHVLKAVGPGRKRATSARGSPATRTRCDPPVGVKLG